MYPTSPAQHSQPDQLTRPRHKHLSQRRTRLWCASLRWALHHSLARLHGAGVEFALAGCASLPHDPPRLVTPGSLNFDPRSAKHNTELGFIIRSPQLAEELLTLAELVKTEAAYRVRLGADKSSLEWNIASSTQEETLYEEPDSGFWERLWLRLVGPLVPEALL